MICIVDYGVGNIHAFLASFKQMGLHARRAASPDALEGAVRLVLPGVGHFDHAMHRLNDSGMRPVLERLVLEQRVPVLGVCVGMQMLARGSDEGRLPGLNWIPGRVKAFADHPQSTHLPMPHMGWNTLEPKVGASLFAQEIGESPQFYFLHSFYFEAADRRDVAATAKYGLDFDAVVSRGHIHGIQCHPEKSHRWGMQLLKNFIEL